MNTSDASEPIESNRAFDRAGLALVDMFDATTPSRRTISHWKLRTRSLELGQRTLVMGVVNITPDSFSDGGRFLDPEAAVAQALTLLDDGADLLDLGAESTRPGSRAGDLAEAAVSAEQEQARLLPVIEGILEQPARRDPLRRHLQSLNRARRRRRRHRDHQRR